MNGDELRDAYINLGFSRRGFAEHVDVPEQSLRRLESGQRVHPATAKKIADKLGVQVTDLMPVQGTSLREALAAGAKIAEGSRIVRDRIAEREAKGGE